MIRHLPAGRFRVAASVARFAGAPFVAPMQSGAGRLRFWCDLHDHIARDAYFTGSYEPQVTQVFCSLVRPAMTILDVGANWGYFTLLAAHLTGPAGRVIALEPDHRMFDLLERNRALNQLDMVTALPVAAGPADGHVLVDGYAAGADNRGVSRTRAHEGAVADGSVTVPSVRLDHLLDRHGIASADLVKIDVEGAEDGVLEGMADGIRAGRYPRVLLELHPALLAERHVTPDACCDLLRSAGYRGWAFDHSAAAVRRASFRPGLALAELIQPSDHVPPLDPWPHMLWTRPDAAPL